jgi:3-methyladenine DNA glycosylase AlkD
MIRPASARGNIGRTMTAENKALIRELRAELAKAARAEDAPIMQRYMKSEMPYYGVKSTPLRQLCKQVFARHPLSSFEAWRDSVLALYRGAKKREERYAALELMGQRQYRAYRTMKALGLYEELIVSGAWWDLVDGIATHRLGELLREHPAQMRRTMLRWSRSEDMWKRRCAILCQNRFKQDTDLELLFACIEPSIDSGEFFLRKAIGWALRQYAWTDPGAVVRYVREHEQRLSGLTKREALKNVGRRSRAPAGAVSTPARSTPPGIGATSPRP